MLDKALYKSKQNESHLKTNDPQEVKTGTTCAPWTIAFRAWQSFYSGILFAKQNMRIQSEEQKKLHVMKSQGHPELPAQSRTHSLQGTVFAIEEVTHWFVRNDKLSNYQKKWKHLFNYNAVESFMYNLCILFFSIQVILFFLFKLLSDILVLNTEFSRKSQLSYL